MKDEDQVALTAANAIYYSNYFLIRLRRRTMLTQQPRTDAAPDHRGECFQIILSA